MSRLFQTALITKVEPFKAQIYLQLIERAINKAIIQYDRIGHGDLSVRQFEESVRMKRIIIPSLTTMDRSDLRWERMMTTLFSDIHHYLICWAEVSKLYDKLRKVQPIFTAVPKKFLEDLREHREFRNHLEHIEDRVERGVTELGVLSGGKFVFDGKQLDISDQDLEKLKIFHEKLVELAYENFEQPFLRGPSSRKPKL